MTTQDSNNSQQNGGDSAPKPVSKPGNSRTRRRAAQRAKAAEAARQRQEQEARERRTRSIILAVAALIVVVALIAGIIIWNKNSSKTTDTAAQASEEQSAYATLQETLKTVQNIPSHATAQGGFVITKNYDYQKIDGAPTIEEYFDPLCPGCGSLNRKIDTELETMVKAGQINLEIHPNGFLDQLTTDQYPTRAAAAIAYVAENDPEHVLDFIKGLYAEDFQPSETNYKAVSDADIQQVATDAGATADVASHCTDGTYIEWVDAMHTYTPHRAITKNVEGNNKGSMTTPTIIINGYFWNLVELTSSDYAQLILQAIGLDESNVGTDVMPSIGSDGAPLVGANYLSSSDSASSSSSSSK